MDAAASRPLWNRVSPPSVAIGVIDGCLLEEAVSITSLLSHRPVCVVGFGPLVRMDIATLIRFRDWRSAPPSAKSRIGSFAILAPPGVRGGPFACGCFAIAYNYQRTPRCVQSGKLHRLPRSAQNVAGGARPAPPPYIFWEVPLGY